MTGRASPQAGRTWPDAALRIVGAGPLGYAVASLWAMALARTLPMPPHEASVAAMLVSFALVAAAAVFALAARSGLRAVVLLSLTGAIATAIVMASGGWPA